MALILRKQCPDRTADPDGLIRTRLARGAGGFMVIAPTRRKVRELLREYTAASPGGVSGPLQIFTLETLAGAVCEILAPGRQLLRGPMQTAFVQEAIHRCGRLKYFRPAGGRRRIPSGTLEKIANVINRMKESGVYLPVLLAEMSEIDSGSGSDRARLDDLYAIYEAYEALLGERFTDPPGQLRLVNLAWDPERSPAALLARYPGTDLLVVGGFDEFTDPEIALLDNLSSIRGLATIISFDYHPRNDQLFGHLSENYRKFLALGFEGGEGAAQASSPAGKLLASSLFNSSTTSTTSTTNTSGTPSRSGGSGSKRPEPGERIHLHLAQDRLREAQLIAGIIKTTVHDDPSIGLHEICVAVPRPELYSSIFREAFEAAGIPANITDRFTLAEAPPVATLMALLDVAQNDFRSEDVVRALSGHWLDFGSGPDAGDAYIINRAAVALRIRRGKSVWRSRIDAALRARADAAARPAGGIHSAELEHARTVIERMATVLEPLSAPLTPAGFTSAVGTIAERLGIARGIIESLSLGAADPDDTERDARAHAAFIGLLEEFRRVLHVELGPEEKLPLRAYLDRLRPLLAGARFNIRRKPKQGVLVTSPDETRGLSFKVMIVGGLVDGEFPVGYQPDVFLTPRRRARREEFHLHTERYRFYQAVTNFERALHLTWPARDGKKTLQPSPFIDAFRSASGARPPETDPATDNETGVIASIDELMGVPALHGLMDRAAAGFASKAAVVTAARHIRAGSDEFRGFVTMPAAGDDSRRQPEEIYPITALERYINCPFQYFAVETLGLRPIDHPARDVDAKEFGQLVHEILYAFFQNRAQRGLPRLDEADADSFARAVAEMMILAGEIIDAKPGDDALWRHQRRVLLGDESTPGLLRTLLDAERTSGLGVEPHSFEVQFGRPLRRPARHGTGDGAGYGPVRAGKILISGAIDRIDTKGDAFRVVDYKTGGAPARKDINEGRSLQLPLYLHAASNFLPGPDGRRPKGVAGVYYLLKSGFREWPGLAAKDAVGTMVRRTRARMSPDEEAFNGLIEQAIGAANRAAEGIAAGRYPVEPSHPRHCRTCEVRTVCRIAEERSIEAGDAGEGGDPASGEAGAEG